VVLGLDDGHTYLSNKFVEYVTETQDTFLSLELSDSMLEMKNDSMESLLGSISHMSGSIFQNPTIFGTLAVLSSKIEVLDGVGPPLIDFMPVIIVIEKFKAESKNVQNLTITLVTALSDKVEGLETGKKAGKNIAFNCSSSHSEENREFSSKLQQPHRYSFSS
jgi:hypothetical protein